MGRWGNPMKLPKLRFFWRRMTTPPHNRFLTVTVGSFRALGFPKVIENAGTAKRKVVTYNKQASLDGRPRLVAQKLKTFPLNRCN
jgi:hypothetical protein